jgi:hypothetical protein
MSVKSIDTNVIPIPDGVHEVKHRDGDTWDIVKVIFDADTKLGKYMCEFANQFESSYAGLYDLWSWVHKNIKYVPDKPGHEKVKDPRVTWSDGNGDCKSFSLFIASVLRCLGIRYKYRFASYDGAKDPTHVYVIASIDKKEIILDAVHDKFDDEAGYSKKWDKMQTRISYLHGLQTPAVRTTKAIPTRFQRIADAPKQIAPKININLKNLSEGQLTLELLDDQIRILIAHYGDPDGILQKARNIIFQAKRGHFHYNNTLPTGYIDPRLNDLIRQIKQAATKTRISGTPYHIGDQEYKRPAAYPKNCNDMKQTAEYKELYAEYSYLMKIPFGNGGTFNNNGRSRDFYENKRYGELYKYFKAFQDDLNSCTLSQEFANLLTNRIDKSAHHMLYEFVTNPNNQPNAVGTKTILHKVGISAMSELAYIDRNNVRIMAENGIMRTNSGIKDINDITPAATLDILKDAHLYDSPAARIGVFPLALVTGIILAIGGAITAAAQLQQAMNERKRIEFSSKVNGFGTPTYSPDPLDWESKNDTTSVFGSVSKVLPYALLGGAALLIIPPLLKTKKS